MRRISFFRWDYDYDLTLFFDVGRFLRFCEKDMRLNVILTDQFDLLRFVVIHNLVFFVLVLLG